VIREDLNATESIAGLLLIRDHLSPFADAATGAVEYADEWGDEDGTPENGAVFMAVFMVGAHPLRP
jgi:hypothetical protein